MFNKIIKNKQSKDIKMSYSWLRFFFSVNIYLDIVGIHFWHIAVILSVVQLINGYGLGIHFWHIAVILSVVQLINGYGLNYNYFDEMAQSYCASNSHGFTFALRRDCKGIAPTCENICKNAADRLLASISNQRRK